MSSTSVYDALSALPAAVNTALAATPAGQVNRVVFSPGAELAWDECDCGQLALVINRRYPSRTFPQDSSDNVLGECDDIGWVIDCKLSIVRCTPGPDDNGDPPTPAAMLAAWQTQESDAYTIRNVVRCYLQAIVTSTPRLIANFIVNDQPSVGPLGNCAGTELNFKIGFYTSCGC